MLDIGSWEFLLVIVLGLVVIGPKELPGVIRTVGQWVRRAKDLAREFQGGLEDIAREAEVDKLKENLESEFADTNTIGQDMLAEVDPDHQIAREFDFEEGDFYSDHQDLDEDLDEHLDEDEDMIGPPVAKKSKEGPAPITAESTTESDASADEPVETDTKTDR